MTTKTIDQQLDEIEAEIQACEQGIATLRRARTLAAARFHDLCYGEAAYRARATLGSVTIIEGNA
jgi:hypothetical protein